MNHQRENEEKQDQNFIDRVTQAIVQYADFGKEKVLEFSKRNGFLSVPAAISVPLKILLFYYLIGISSNFFLVWLITCVLTFLLFKSFRNQWIPAVLYLLLSILMFADVTYSSFFNRYLSVNMLGAAGVLGDITASIKEVLKPAFFLILSDAILVIAALAVKKKQPAEADAAFESESARRRRRRQKKKISTWIRGRKYPLTALLILIFFISNVSGSFMITSVSNQEIYDYHIKDILGAVTGKGNPGTDSMYAFTDSYRTEKNGPLFGVAKDRNLIVIQIESFENFVIGATYNGQEITPNLNRLLKEDTIYCNQYYQQIGSGNTSDAEFATNNSIYGTLASYTYKLYDKNYFRGLPVLLKEKGYQTAVFHAHENRTFWNRENMYPAEGFDTYYGGIGGSDKGQYDMTEWMGWGLTDTEFFKQTMVYLKQLPQPFYSFLITLSNHHPYIMLDHYKFIDLLPEDEGTILGNYLNSAAYTDYAIGQLIQQLKDAGLYDNSIIAMYGDHQGLPKTDEEIATSVSRFIGKDYDFDTMMNIPLIINIPGAGHDINQTVETAGGQLDFLPTIAYLMGFEQLDTIYLGHNLLTVGSGFVTEQTYMTKGSFFENDIAYEMSRDGVFENGRAWNKKSGKEVPVEQCYDGYLRSMGLINTSDYILENDVLRKIYVDHQSVSNAFSGAAETEYPDKIAEAGIPDPELAGTNSLEALNASYDAGYRNIKVQVCWTEDKEAILLNSWETLGRYFQTDKASEIPLEEFQNLPMKNGLTPMDILDLISWVKDHLDVTVIAQTERSADYFMKCIGSYDKSMLDRFIIEVQGMAEYSGLYHSIMNVDIGGNSADQILNFIQLNQVDAIVMSEKSAEGKYKELLKSDCTVYVEEAGNGLLTKQN